jgi:hypothetical protein
MKKENLKTILFNNAWKIVEEEGIEHLNARKLAKLSSCAVGSIYTNFENFQELQLAINAKIITLLYNCLTLAFEESLIKEKKLEYVLKEMGLAYIHFGQKNLFLWKSLFEYLPFEVVPQWYAKHTKEGIENLCQKLAIAFALDPQEAKRIVGFFWAGIHGVSSILLNQKMKMVSELFDTHHLDTYVQYCLNGLFKEAHIEPLNYQFV